MWHSSPSPKYGKTSSGHWLASARKEAVLVARVHLRAHLLEDLVRLGQVLVVGTLALYKVGNGVQPQAVYPGVEPEAHHAHDRLEHLRVVVVEVGLVEKKRCQKYWPAISSYVQLDRSVSVNIMRVPSYLSGVSLQT